MACSVRSFRNVKIIIFAGLVAVLQFGWSSARDTSLERFVINDITVKPAAWLINHINPEIKVEADGNHLKAIGGGINILKGCEGGEVIILLAAALMVAQLKLKWRLLGVVVGSIVILSCNQVRILAMFFINRNDKHWFEIMHGIVAPVILILIATGYFLFWIEFFSPKSELHEV